MATVIDRLVVELGLDPSRFTAGQKKALDDAKKGQQELLDRSNKFEDAARRQELTFSKIRNQALGLLGMFLGGRGLKDFVQWVTTSDAATGRLANRLGTSTEMLSKWKGAAELVGGTAEGMAGSIEGLVQQFQAFAVTGQSELIPYLRALGVVITDDAGKMRPFNEIFLDLNRAFLKLDPSRAAFFGKALGLDRGAIDLLLLAPDALRKILVEQERLSKVTAQDAKQAQDLAGAFNEAAQAAVSVGRAWLNEVSPGLRAALGVARDFFQLIRENVTMLSLLPGAMGFGTGASKGARALGRGAGAGSGTGSGVGGGSAGGAAGLRTKGDSGEMSVGIAALAKSLQNEIPELKQFTSFNDAYHRLLGAGGHTKGLALDFTLSDPSKSGEVSDKIRAKLAAMGINARVIDEYRTPSRGSTGGHIHVGFADAAAAARYRELSTGGGGAASIDNSRTSSSSSTSDVKVGTVVVNTQATDAQGIANSIKPALERSSLASQANSGPQ